MPPRREANDDQGSSVHKKRRVLIIVHNLPVPFDRRVWLESLALVNAGIGVSVICPRGQGDPLFQELEGVRIYKYPAVAATSGKIGFLLEFAYGLIATAVLSLWVLMKDGFHAVQACNPPDTYFVLGALYRVLGKPFVFDQHDLSPEIYRSRYGDGGPLLRALYALERLTYATADHVISTNESYRAIAMDRGAVAAERVTVVRNGPDLERMQPVKPNPDHKQGRQHLCCYLGVMGPQDGVDMVVRSAAELIAMGRDDCQFALLGYGEELERLQQLARDLGVEDWITFTGRADDDMIRSYLSTADVALCPDPPTAFNNVSTMIKTMEYMAFGLPMVAFDLLETRFSAGQAARYVGEVSPQAFAGAIDELLSDPEQRERLGQFGLTRVRDDLAWHHQSPRYIGVFAELLGGTRAGLKK